MNEEKEESSPPSMTSRVRMLLTVFFTLLFFASIFFVVVNKEARPVPIDPYATPPPPDGSITGTIIPTPLFTQNPNLNYDITQRNPVPQAAVFSPVDIPAPIEVPTITQAGVIWLDEPEILTDDRGLFQPDYERAIESGAYVDGSVELRKVGTDNGLDILQFIISGLGESVYFLRETRDGYEYLADEYDIFEGGGNEVYFTQSVTHGGKLAYTALQTPDSFTLGGLPLVKIGSMTSIFRFSEDEDWDHREMELFAYTKYGPMYRVSPRSKPDDYTPGFNWETYYLKQLDGGLSAYHLGDSFSGDDLVPGITWSDGTSNESVYLNTASSLGGCGSSATLLLEDATSDGTLFETGRTISGEPIYEFTDPLHPVMKHFYDLSEGTYRTYSKEAGGNTHDLALSDFINLRGLFVYRDAAGRFIIYSRSGFAPGAECAKPVIYLYPEEETNVTVEVGAIVTKSEPVYEGGWDVIAQPDGMLTTQDGLQYDSLFWDGYGHGMYPNVKEHGFVIEQSRLENTIIEHLDLLGLNQKEKDDFLEFWLPHMPDTPFVRLTWLGTREMDKLAPLTVSPKPDTNIRVFLDFEGLQQPIDLEPQNLTSIERRGFTLIEWGGLLVH